MEERFPLKDTMLGRAVGETYIPAVPDTVQPETATGNLLSDGVQFIEGMATVGKVLGPLKFAAGAARTAEVAGRSGATFATFFDPYRDRLSNLVQNYPSIANPVAAFLSANPDDPEMVARLKNGLENAGLGVLVDGVAQGIVSVAHYIKGKPEAALQAATSVKPYEPPVAPTAGETADSISPVGETRPADGVTAR